MLNEEEKDEKITLKLSDVLTDDLKSALGDGKKKTVAALEKLTENDDEGIKQTAEVLLNAITKKSDSVHGWKPKEVIDELKKFGESSEHKDLKEYTDSLGKILENKKENTDGFGQPKSMDDLKRRYHDLGYSLTIHAFVQVAAGATDSKKASTSGEDFQAVAAKDDGNDDFMSTFGSLEDRYLVDAAGLAHTMMKKIKPAAAKEIPSPWKPEGESEEAQAKDALKKANEVKNKFDNQFKKSYELLKNSFQEGCDSAVKDIKEGKEVKDPLTGEAIGGDTFTKMFKDFTAEKLDNLGKGILGLKTDILTIGPQMAVKLLNSIFHKDGNLHRLFKLGAKGYKSMKKKRAAKKAQADSFDNDIKKLNDEKLEKYKTATEIVLAAYKEFVAKKEDEKPKNEEPEENSSTPEQSQGGSK